MWCIFLIGASNLLTITMDFYFWFTSKDMKKIEIFVTQVSLNWRTESDGVTSAKGCDFKGTHLSRVNINSEGCGKTCLQTNECTHFAWTNYEGGKCMLKKGHVSKKQAIAIITGNATCGIIERPTPIPPPPPSPPRQSEG
jgi:hypothetical protein